MQADVWMPLHIGKYLAKTMHLTGPQHGAYLLLLIHYWCNGPIEDDDAILAAIARTDRETWDSAVGPVVRRFFRKEADGLLHQKRADDERAKALDISEKRRRAGSTRHGGGSSAGGNGPDPNGAPPLQGSLSNCSANAEQEPDKPPANGVHDSRVRAGLPLPSPEEDSREASPHGALAPSPASPAARPPPDVRTALWTEGLARLRRLTGKPDRPARALLGRWCRDARDDCALVASVLFDAEAARIGDPVPWIEAAISHRTGQRASAGPPSKLAWIRDYVIERGLLTPLAEPESAWPQ
jgi:hypothetical protein